MLPRDADPEKVKLIGFLVGAEVLTDEVSNEYLLNKIADSIAHVEGVGRIDVEILGEMEVELGEPEGSC